MTFSRLANLRGFPAPDRQEVHSDRDRDRAVHRAGRILRLSRRLRECIYFRILTVADAVQSTVRPQCARPRRRRDSQPAATSTRRTTQSLSLGQYDLLHLPGATDGVSRERLLQPDRAMRRTVHHRLTAWFPDADRKSARLDATTRTVRHRIRIARLDAVRRWRHHHCNLGGSRPHGGVGLILVMVTCAAISALICLTMFPRTIVH